MIDLMNKTISEIVTDNHRAAPVFEKYGLDFCCKGKRPLKTACADKEVDLNRLLADLNRIFSDVSASSPFNNMSITELSTYIVRVHHNYVKTMGPQILAYLSKVNLKHGDLFPYVGELIDLFAEVQRELEEHMVKEEKILFPRLRQVDGDDRPDEDVAYIQATIDILEADHDHAALGMQTIRALSNDFRPPATACTTHILAITSLKAFEEDLHQHVHLENNILFPKALAKSQQSRVKRLL